MTAAATFEVCGVNCCDPESDTPQCCNGVCVAASVECCNAENPCNGECETCVDGACIDDQEQMLRHCSVCVDGTCQANPATCLACEACRFNPETNTGNCVDICTGCTDCQLTDAAPNGTCVADPSECLSCQICVVNGAGTGGTCNDNCPGCESCTITPGGPVCQPDNSQCVAPAICCDRANACVDLSLPTACCVDADCDTPPDGCSVGTCGDNNVCSYRSQCDGEC